MKHPTSQKYKFAIAKQTRWTRIFTFFDPQKATVFFFPSWKSVNWHRRAIIHNCMKHY